jgi:Putative transposase
VVPAGGLSADHTRWIPSQHKFFLPVELLSEVFRGKFREALEEAFAKGQLGFHGSMKAFARPKIFRQLLRLTFRKNWVVYSKRPFGGPEHALRYLGCYTHRVAISNHRLVSSTDDKVTFRWRDSAHGNKKRLLSLHVNEFLRRFLLHVLPPSFVRIRYFGFLSTRNRSQSLPVCVRLLEAVSAEPVSETTAIVEHKPHATWLCPRCNGPMLLLERFTALQLRFRAPPDLLPAAA